MSQFKISLNENILVQQYNQNKLIDFVMHSNLFDNVNKNSLNVKALDKLVSFFTEKIDSFRFSNWSDFVEYKKMQQAIGFMSNILHTFSETVCLVDNCAKKVFAQKQEVFSTLYMSLADNGFNEKIKKLLKTKISFERKTIITSFLNNGYNDDCKKIQKLKLKVSTGIQEFNELNNDDKETLKSSIYIRKEEAYKLNGLPVFMKNIGMSNAKFYKKEGYVFILQTDTVVLLLELLKNRGMREKVYNKFFNITQKGIGKFATKNEVIVKKVLADKQKLAKLLNKNNFAELAFSNFNLNTTEKVYNYLEEIEQQLFSNMSNIGNDIKSLARKDKITKMQPWDLHFYVNKMKKIQEDKTENTLVVEQFSQYYQFNKVIRKIRKFIENKFQFVIEEVQDSISKNMSNGFTWRIKDIQTGKRSYWIVSPMNNGEGVWYASNLIQIQYLENDILPDVQRIQLQIPQSLSMSFSDVKNTMHEFGHALSDFFSMKKDDLTDNKQMTLDLLELPSQFLEHLVYEESFMKEISSHKTNSKKISSRLLNKMIQIEQYSETYDMFMNVQKYKAKVLIHEKYKPHSQKNPNDLVKNDLIKLGLIYSISKDVFFGLNQNVLEYDYGTSEFIYLYSAQIAFKVYNSYRNEDYSLREVFDEVLSPTSKKLTTHLQDLKIELNTTNVIEFLQKNKKIKLLGDTVNA